MDCMYWLTTSYWTICILGCILVITTPFFSSIHAYGKLRVGNKQRICGMLPKHLFSHFYYVGLLWSAVLLYTCNTDDKSLFTLIRAVLGITLRGCEDAAQRCQDTARKRDDTVQVNAALLGIFLHTGVRLWESVFLFRKGSAKMHLFGYLIGMSFYVAAPWTIVVSSSQWRCEHFEISLSHQREDEGDEVDVGFLVKGVVVSLLYVWSSVHQHWCHKILARLRDGRAGDRYSIPVGDYFEWVSCPHYFMEIVLYFSLLLWNDFELNSVLLFLFVVMNLGITARKTHQWYLDKFPEDYPKHRKAIIPYVL